MRKLGYLIFSFILLVILFEVSLRLAGYIYYAYRLPGREISGDTSVTRILCLGDSFTFGLGAKKGYSFPEQLEKLLNSGSEKKFVVYNAAVPGTNSSYLYKNLEANIKKYRPDIAVIMTGINDNADFTDSNYFLFMDDGLKTRLYRLDALLSHLRSYKLFKWIAASLINKCGFGRKSAVPLLAAAKQGSVTGVESESSKEARLHFVRAVKYEKEYKYKLAIEQLKYSIKLNPQASQPYALMGFIYLHRLKNLDLAVTYLKKSLELDPLNIRARENLMLAYHRADKRRLALEQARELSRLSPGNEHYRQLLKFGFPKYGDLKPFKAMLKYDLNNIRNLLMAKKIILILQNYPGGWPNDTLREFAQQYELPFVDNEAAFKGLGNRNDYFAEDGHCNEDGNRIIAVNVYNLLKSKF